MDLEALYLAMPSLTADLEPSSSQLLWSTDIYGFLLAGWVITMGTLGDRIGRRRLLRIGADAFGVASVVAAFSTTVEMLIAARALLGVAAATLAPSTLSLIRNMFLDRRRWTFAIGVCVTSFSVGAAIGPLLGGLLLEFFWWGSVFLLAVPVMALFLVLGPKLLPEFRDPDAGGLNLISVALALAEPLQHLWCRGDGDGDRADGALTGADDIRIPDVRLAIADEEAGDASGRRRAQNGSQSEGSHGGVRNHIRSVFHTVPNQCPALPTLQLQRLEHHPCRPHLVVLPSPVLRACPAPGAIPAAVPPGPAPWQHGYPAAARMSCSRCAPVSQAGSVRRRMLLGYSGGRAPEDVVTK
jgi:hypothetical protein